MEEERLPERVLHLSPPGWRRRQRTACKWETREVHCERRGFDFWGLQEEFAVEPENCEAGRDKGENEKKEMK
jgi:hypothetical protein